MPPHSLLLHSRSFRPLRNTFRSIDFAVDTQAVGTERRRSRKSARVKGGETGARLATRWEGKGGGGKSEHIGRKGEKKRNAAAETRSRNKRVARVERGTGQRNEREGPKEERCETETENERESVKGREREREKNGRNERGRKKKGTMETGSARDREETRERPRPTTHLPTGVKNGSFAPASTTPANQPPAADRLSFSSLPSTALFFLVVSLVASIFLAPACKTNLSHSPFRRVPLFLSHSPTAAGKQIHPGGKGGRGGEAVSPSQQSSSLARRFECN